MSPLDWIVLLGTLAFIVIYGAWKTRGSKDMEDYLLGDREMKWYTIGLSVMATQASAITFLSTPGQAYESGMGFVQFYFGLPLAMIILCIAVIPRYYKLKVYTAYEYLETRFDLKTRQLAAMLFLIQRGLAAGITIYAPAIILAAILGWPLNFTNIFIGALVIIYTVAGGTKAVSVTQKQQMAVIFIGMLVAFFIILDRLPGNVSFLNAVNIAGSMGKMNIINTSFDPNERYTLWSGLTGGLFLALSYFGTDQSQVQRYLGGSSIKESRLGLLFNGLLKVPMQFFILLTGIMVFVFYQYVKPPLIFNEAAYSEARQAFPDEVKKIEDGYLLSFNNKKAAIEQMVNAQASGNEEGLHKAKQKALAEEKNGKELREQAKELISRANPEAETKDTDYVFITFIMTYLPKGIVGLLLAVIFCAAMSSTSSELNALASTTVVDFYKRSLKPAATDKHYVNASKWLTVMWGVLAISFAIFASLIENLIQAVNILGSLFYGTLLGIFLVAFFVKYVKSKAVFIAALISETIVISLYFMLDIGFLWFNVIGCLLTILLSVAFQPVFPSKK